MHKTKSIIALLLAVILLMQIAPCAFAEDTETPVDDPIIERYTNIDGAFCSCYISGITLYATATLTAKSSMSLKIKIEVQKLKSGEYSTVETWTGSKTGIYLTLDEHRTINIFSTYRIKVTFTAGGESTTLYDYA